MLYLVNYCDPNSDWYALSEEEQGTLLMDELKLQMPAAEVAWCRVFKLRHSKPIYGTAYRRHSLRYHDLDNLFFAGTSTFPDMRNMGGAMETGALAARRLLAAAKP